MDFGEIEDLKRQCTPLFEVKTNTVLKTMNITLVRFHHVTKNRVFDVSLEKKERNVIDLVSKKFRVNLRWSRYFVRDERTRYS